MSFKQGIICFFSSNNNNKQQQQCIHFKNLIPNQIDFKSKSNDLSDKFHLLALPFIILLLNLDLLSPLKLNSQQAIHISTGLH